MIESANAIKLSKFLKDGSISLQMTGRNKHEILRELVELLSKSRKIRNKKAFLKAVLEREKLGSTGIGNGVAIPHARAEGVGDFIIAFARSNEGCDFGALDGEKTFLFFALASPKKEVGGHLKILAAISRVVKDKFIVECLRKAKNSREIMKVIASAQRNP